MADSLELRRRFVEYETNDSETVVLSIIVSMCALAALLLVCCGGNSTGEMPICHGVIVPTIIDAIFGGNRRQRALRPLAP